MSIDDMKRFVYTPLALAYTVPTAHSAHTHTHIHEDIAEHNRTCLDGTEWMRPVSFFRLRMHAAKRRLAGPHARCIYVITSLVCIRDGGKQ